MRDWLRRKRIGVALVGVAAGRGLLNRLAPDGSTQSPAHRPRRPGPGHRAGRSGSGPGTVRRAASGDGARRLDDVGVGARPEGAAGRMGPGRKPAGFRAEQWSGGAHSQPNGAGARPTVPLDGLDQPHGLAFSGSTLYVAESDQIDAYDYADGAATNRRTVAAGLPDARSPDLRGAYSHALKSVAVGPDGAVYFSIGSTGNITADDRTANPPRATIMRIPPGGGPAAAVRDRRAQRHGSGDRARRFGVDGGQQPRQRREPADLARSAPTTSTTIRPRPSPG